MRAGSEQLESQYRKTLASSGAAKGANSFIRKLPRVRMYLETELRSFGQMNGELGLNRRCFLWSGLAFSNRLRGSERVKDETVYHFATRECDVRMTVEFYDRYASKGFWFHERRTDKQYCLSADGQEGSDCLSNFSGSIAVAHYRVRSRSHPLNRLVLRERVRTIDRDSRLDDRPPFERTLRLQGGLAAISRHLVTNPALPMPEMRKHVSHMNRGVFSVRIFTWMESAPRSW